MRRPEVNIDFPIHFDARGHTAEAGTDKSRLLSANVWLADMARFDVLSLFISKDLLNAGTAPPQVKPTH